MSKRILLGLLITALLLFLGLPGFAQESTVKGNLAGVVLDSSGAVVQGATVTLSGPTGNRTAKTDVDGKFVFAALTPGVYGVKVEQTGFKAADVKGVEVATGRTSSLRMQLEPGAVSETVEVSANAVTVDTTSTATGANLNDAFYASVPVPRNVSGLFYVAPGVADSGRSGRANPSISGGSGLENLYVADGVNITDPAFGGLGIFTRQYGSVGTGINLSFIKEVQVKTGGFEPQYGQSTGGVVQIVTKSGSENYHGMLAGFFAPASTAATPKVIDNFRQNPSGRDAFTANALIPGAPGFFAGSGAGSYDVDAELGGYIPGFRNHLFFFGSYNPTLTTDYQVPPTASSLSNIFGNRAIYTRGWTNNYAGKLTWKINNSQTFESSVFGDPTSTNQTAFRTVFASNTTVFSAQQFQTRNWVARYNATFSPTWLFNANITWNHNEFTETPSSPDVFNVVDRTSSITPTIQGLGFVENHNADNFSYEIDTSKTVHFWGQHTFMIGGTEQFLNYNDLKSRTGGTFSLPGVPTPVNAQFSLRPAGACPPTLCPVDPLTGVNVLLLSSRSEFGPPTVATEGLGMALYGNDAWTINKYLTFNLGLRWDQYQMKGVASKYTFTDNWAPRLGVAWDPWGDRKSKLYLNWARYNYQMPLDAAIRSLSQELDLTGLRIAPVFNADGTVQVHPDAAHILNGQFGFGNFATSQQAVEGFAPGTKMQYEDEYVAGVERDLGHGVILSARYVDRRLRRVVEDMGGVSPEASLAFLPDGSFPLQQLFLIGNPSSKLDLFTNEPKPEIQPLNPATCTAATDAVANSDANGNNFPGNVQACFHSQTGVNGLIGGTVTPDGISDGFADPVRNYQAAEFELNKGFSNGWLMRFNYRLAYLRGNYEGAFRNDNGQTDPSISSLFDFTTGVLNLLGDQFAVGPLNTDRHHVANAFFSYTFTRSAFRGLTLGTGMRVQSGTPISVFADHPAYGNQGEVPLGGRGILGRTQPSGAVDLHGEYARKMTERFTFRVGADLFNVTNSQPITVVDQNRDLSFNSPGSNLDFRAPLVFQNPFYSRFSLKLEF